MPVKDTFQYVARWDSVGLDCSKCEHFRGPVEWPDITHQSYCKFHAISLSIELGPDNFKVWEWFCRDFSSNGTALPLAVGHFQSIRQKLTPRVLYRLYGQDGYLVEHPMEQLGAPK